MRIKVYFHDNPTLSDLWNGFVTQMKPAKKSYLLEFVDVPFFVAVLSNNLNEPVYFIEVEKKRIAECELRDWFDHVVLVGEAYFKGNYLQKIRWRNISKFQFKLLPIPVYLEPDEVYQPFVEIDENLTITKELYMTIASQL